MKDPITFTEDIQTSFKKMKVLSISFLVAVTVLCLGAFYLAFNFVKQRENTIFVVDDGYILAATRQDNTVQKDLEVINHVTRFHELMYNLAPDLATIKTNIERASALGITPAVEIDLNRQEKQFYTQMIQLGAVEEIAVDSVKVDISSYPFKARTWATLYFIRSSNVAKYSYVSNCTLIDTQRSPTNPHGLSIETFVVEEQRQIETSTRK